MQRTFRSIASSLAYLAIGSAPLDAQKPATFLGRTFADTTFKPLDGAEVRFPDLGKTAMTGTSGAFRIDSIPPGLHRVQVRKVGFASFDASITFGEGASVERAVVLPRLANLNAVVVLGDSYTPMSAIEHQAAGLGHLITRAHLEQQGNRSLSEVLAQVPGLALVLGRNNQGWILSKRYSTPIRAVGPTVNPCTQADPSRFLQRNQAGSDMWYPDCGEMSRGMKPGCYARVYLDRQLLNPGTPAEPVNVNDHISQSIEAIEYFASASQTPQEYARLNSNCGVLVIHTRRSP